MLKIYLDNCCYNRPFDDQSQLKIHIETLAKLHIQEQIRQGVYKLVWSYVLDYENSNNPYVYKREAITPWRNIASEIIRMENDEIIRLAESIKAKGIKSFDALHVACAFYAKCDYFLTTDRKLSNLQFTGIKIVNPVSFIHEMEG